MPEFKPYLHHPCETKKVLAQNSFSGPVTGSVPGPAISNYFRCPLGVLCSQSFPLYPKRGAETPPLHCMCCQFKFWLCERGYEGSSFSPKDSVGSRMQQRMCQGLSDISKLEKLGTWLISHSECLVQVVPCRNPAMTLVPGSLLQPGLPLKTSFNAWQPICKKSHPGTRGNIQESGRSFRPLGLRYSSSQPKHQLKRLRRSAFTPSLTHAAL